MIAYDPHDPPLMGCGHTANATWDSPEGPEPSCAICVGIKDGATTVVERPSLAGRTALCGYSKGRDGRTHEPIPSGWTLPFFEHLPDEDHDRYYCGCRGWD